MGKAKVKLVGAHLTEEQKRLVEMVAEAQGLSISEYLRLLILKDLEERNLLTTKIEKIKEGIRRGEL